MRAYGILKKDTFVEYNALELKGQYCGWTAPKVQGAVRSAMGGCLFLDEAYALAGGDTFSKEAIRTLLTEVENNRTSVMVILAGYRDKMAELMSCDPGLPRRFPLTYHLENYRPAELALIAEERARKVFDMTFEDGLKDKLAEAFNTHYASEISEHNGGLAVRVVEEAVSRFASRMDRLMQLGSCEDAKAACGNRKLTARDFNLESLMDKNKAKDELPPPVDEDEDESEEAKGERRIAEAEAAEKAEEVARRLELQRAAMDELNGMIGFEDAKKFVHKLILKVKYVQAGGSKRVLDTCRNLVLTGNPGVGKTSFARILHKVLYAHGVLRDNVFVERNALQLKGQYVGQTSPKGTNAFAAAKGGTLFLDEAYALAGDMKQGGDCFSRDAIATLLTESENHRTDVMVILAGYDGPMQRLLDADPGLRRRFPHALALPNYSPTELARIADKCARERFDIKLGEGVEEKLADLMGSTRFAAEVAHHNASLPIRLVEEALSAMAERTMSECGDGEDPDLTTLLYQDFVASLR